jgi:endonuclease/exonuclease/phosphatase family metal-dependent hydrolase
MFHTPYTAERKQMDTLKIVSWNVAHLERLVKTNLTKNQQRRQKAIIQEITELSPDILCLLEGPQGEANINLVCNDLLGGEWVPVKAEHGEYSITGDQWIWFLVRKNLAGQASLQSYEIWDALVGRSWKVHYWGNFEETTHRHYRHPQVLVFDHKGFRVEFIGLHLKSKFINGGESMWNQVDVPASGISPRQDFINSALKARIKLATEASNVRAYIDTRFNQVENPPIILMGDFNDGPGKEYFEEKFLFFDLLSNIQGDVFTATKFLNHALFDFPDHLRWSVYFEDFIREEGLPRRDPHILLDHILFTQGLVNGSLPWKIDAHAGKIEHEIHDLINATLPGSAKTSDHKPISIKVSIQ